MDGILLFCNVRYRAILAGRYPRSIGYVNFISMAEMAVRIGAVIEESLK
jgi:hypothetical protein